MTGFKSIPEKSAEAVRVDLAARLRTRAPEIEKAIFTRIRDLSEPVGDEDPAYVVGLQSAVAESLNYGLESIEKGGDSFVPIPPETAKQARRAAREGVRLDTVMRHYMAGNKALEEFIMAEADGIPSQALCQILSDQGPRVDRLMEAVSAEYRDELEQTGRSSAQRRADRALHLLKSNSLVSPTDLDYDFEDIWHVGMILVGPNAEKSARAFAKSTGCRSLSIDRDPEITWIWLGSSQQPIAVNLERLLIDKMPAEISVAIGEPRRGLDGWRLTHREAQVALRVMLEKPQRTIRGRNVLLLAGVMRDDTLLRSLLDTYLAPIREQEHSDGNLIDTLHAYFSAGGNAAAAAHSLGVTRHTVRRRVRVVEKVLGQLLHTCQAELQVALQIDELNGASGGVRRRLGNRIY